MEDEEESDLPPPRKLQAFRNRGDRRVPTGSTQAFQGQESYGNDEEDDDEYHFHEHASPLAKNLRMAIRKLLKAQPLYAKIARHRLGMAAQSAGENGCEDNAAIGATSDDALVIPRSLEKWHIVRRVLDEALEIAEAGGEDALVEVTLRQHDSALCERERIEAYCAEQLRQVSGVRCDVAELERSMNRSERMHRRLNVNGAAQRLEEFERQRTNVEDVHRNLADDLQSIAESLVAQLRKNGAIDSKTREIQQACDVAAEENARANQLLGTGETLEVYRKAKERERLIADADLAQAASECEAEMMRLSQGWAQTEAKYIAEMLELQGEVRRVQDMLDEQRRVVESNLSKQTHDWGVAVEDTQKHIANGMKSLEDLRTQKAAALHREVLQSRQRERDVAESTKHRLEAQMDQVKLQYKAKLKMEELRLGSIVKKERNSVEVAKRNAKLWAHRANIVRESYRGHAIKSGAYINAMPPEQQMELKGFWNT